ncbi:hypothetical protein LINPERPRIM_LOCUS16931 [Linum perenne]
MGNKRRVSRSQILHRRRRHHVRAGTQTSLGQPLRGSVVRQSGGVQKLLLEDARSSVWSPMSASEEEKTIQIRSLLNPRRPTVSCTSCRSPS